MEKLQLPAGFRLMPTQVSGHTLVISMLSVGLLQDTVAGCVLKPMGKPACGKRELEFYKNLKNAQTPLLVQLKSLVPEFYHEEKIMIGEQEVMYIKLQDLTHGIIKPCVMDIKIGKRTWDPLATAEKRADEEEKYVLCKQTLGLCLPGFQMYPIDGGPLQKFSKDYGKKLNVQGFKRTMAMFLNVHPTIYKPFIREILKQVNAIHDWFSIQTLMHFYASSILLVYDFEQLQKHLEWQQQINKEKYLINGNAQIEKNEQRCANGINPTCDRQQQQQQQQIQQKDTINMPLNPELWVKVKMIDFAHVFPAENETLDINYLEGLRNLLHVLEHLLF